MSRFLSQTLIRTTSTASFFTKSSAFRRIHTQPESSSYAELSLAEARAVEKIEDAIHGLIARKSKPDWIQFVPGASYWVPPRQSSYGVAEIVNKLANPLSEEEFMALISLQGWPSSGFYIDNDSEASLTEAPTQEDSSNETSWEDENSSEMHPHKDDS